jgi:hypothetical protein
VNLNSLNIAGIIAVLALVVPAATNLVTHQKAPSWLKASTMIVLSVAQSTAIYVGHLQGHPLHWQGIAFYAAEAFVVAGATYTHAYKPTGLLALLDGLWGSFGLGKPPTPVGSTLSVEQLQALIDAKNAAPPA